LPFPCPFPFPCPLEPESVAGAVWVTGGPFAFLGFFGFPELPGDADVVLVVLVVLAVVSAFPLAGLPFCFCFDVFDVELEDCVPVLVFFGFLVVPADVVEDVAAASCVDFFGFFGFFVLVCVVAATAHAPSVSPWRRCAGHALTEIEIVFLSLWQITIFLPYWYCPGLPYWYCASAIALCARPAPPRATNSAIPATLETAAAITRVLRLSVPTQTPSLVCGWRGRGAGPLTLAPPIGTPTREFHRSVGSNPSHG
jgi:hypothetical protein